MWMHECSECGPATANGLQSWMRHLTEKHILPTEWPSERAGKLTGQSALRPYTTVTESKKKRRKDSIPRPLNSFMIFAQHIRRNVLRIFSDASNSVISQQLGDLWRNVPQEFRSRYDDEANRLVRLHQLEFPNYKYQPKKRQVPISTQHQHAPASTNMQCREVIRTNLDDRRNPVSFGTFKTHIEKSSNCGTMKREDPVLRFTDGTQNRQLFQLNSGLSASAPNQTSNVQSLSSVLPPLLTPSSKAHVTGEYFASQVSCDSAYGSGINSSSSSSASSPVVGDLLSPLKPNTSVNGATSPARRKFQLIPVRPNSQQVSCINLVQPTRQRFLSAQHISQTVHKHVIPSSNRHAEPEKIVFTAPTLSTSTWAINPARISNAQVSHELSTVHRLLSPVYVRLDTSRTGKNEEILLELPPGTTIIQPSNELPDVKLDGSSIVPQPTHSEQRILLTRAINQSTNGHAQVIMNGASQKVEEAHFSPVPHSSCSPTSSCLSPTSVDLFVQSNNAYRVRATPSQQAQHQPPESNRFNYDFDDEDHCDGGDIVMNEPFEMELDVVSASSSPSAKEKHRTPNGSWLRVLDGNSGRVSSPLTNNCHLTPVNLIEMDTLKPLDELDITPDNSLPALDIGDNYESTFDDMMNSIDIATFLPGTMSDNEEGLLLTDVSESNTQPSNNPNNDTLLDGNLSKRSRLNSVIDVEEMLTRLDEKAVIVQQEVGMDPFSLTPARLRPAKLLDCKTETHAIDHSMMNLSSYQAKLNDAQQLFDLDCLEKSSLFSAKPELSFCI